MVIEINYGYRWNMMSEKTLDFSFKLEHLVLKTYGVSFLTDLCYFVLPQKHIEQAWCQSSGLVPSDLEVQPLHAK